LVTPHYRAHARLPTRLKATVVHQKGGWKRQVPVENLGLGGARILVDLALTPGEEITLSLTAPTLWDSLVLGGRIAWVSARAGKYEAGVAFQHASAEAVFALYELISTLGFE
jgi:hypothetical protein